MAIVDELIAGADVGIAQAAFWRQEMRRIAEWFATEDAKLRLDTGALYAEVRGAIDLPLGDGSLFKLSARADRIDRKTDGTLRLIDYKTGALPPSTTLPRFSPQLLLEAVIAERGGFESLSPATVNELVYFHLTGRDPAGECRSLSARLRDHLDGAEAGVKRLLTAWHNKAQAYYPHVPDNHRRHDRYGHLSRWREWIHASLGQGGHRRGPTMADPQDQAGRHQWRASDPALSAFVSANAGSGKTHVLVARVVRLMLAGIPPRAFCPDLHRAAAAEMAERLFSTLAEWLSLSDEDLIKELHELTGDVIFNERLAAARRLFAAPSGRPAVSRSRPFTPSASACCSFLSRPE